MWRLLDTCADDLPQTPRAPPIVKQSRIECLDNLAFVFKALDGIGVDHAGIGPLDVADARLELVLGLVWSSDGPRRYKRERAQRIQVGRHHDAMLPRSPRP